MIWNHGKAIVEALLLASPEPVPVRRIAEVMGVDEAAAANLVRDLSRDYEAPGRGILIQEVAGGYQLGTRPEFAGYVERLITPRGRGLSHAALETLSIIAYRQPVTKSEIEALRGVNVDSSLNMLLERRLVKEAGRKDTPGRPILYATTRDFLAYFGLRDVTDLPRLPEDDAPEGEG